MEGRGRGVGVAMLSGHVYPISAEVEMAKVEPVQFHPLLRIYTP